MSDPNAPGANVPTMTVISDTLHVATSEHHPETGVRYEPEEQPAARVLHVDSAFMDGAGNPLGGQVPTSIAIERTKGEFAEQARSICALCKHFDQDAWHKYMREMRSTKDGLRILNGWHHAMQMTENAAIRQAHPDPDGEGLDSNDALNALGMCRALTEADGNPVMVYPASTCPSHLMGKNGAPDLNKPFPLAFEPRSMDHERKGASMFDAIMNTARKFASKGYFFFKRKDSPTP